MAMAKKTVSFVETVKVRRIPSIDQLSPEEISATWLTDEDIKRQVKKDQKVVKSFVKSDKYNELTLRLNGLESDDAKSQRQRRVRKAKMSVLLEQERQWDNGLEEPDANVLAKVYSEHTQESRVLALNVAIGKSSHNDFAPTGGNFMVTHQLPSCIAMMFSDQKAHLLQSCQSSLKMQR